MNDNNKLWKPDWPVIAIWTVIMIGIVYIWFKIGVHVKWWVWG